MKQTQRAYCSFSARAWSGVLGRSMCPGGSLNFYVDIEPGACGVSWKTELLGTTFVRCALHAKSTQVHHRRELAQVPVLRCAVVQRHCFRPLPRREGARSRQGCHAQGEPYSLLSNKRRIGGGGGRNFGSVGLQQECGLSVRCRVVRHSEYRETRSRISVQRGRRKYGNRKPTNECGILDNNAERRSKVGVHVV